MKKLTAFVVSGLLLIAGNAQASTQGTITLGATSSDVSYSFGGTYTPNLDLQSVVGSGLILSGNAAVVSPANSGPDFLAPESGTDFANSFLAVFASPSTGGVYTNPTPGTATFILGAGQHTLAFTWGSVDAGNTLIVTATNATYTITGTDVANGLLGGNTYGDADLVFNDTAGTVLSATFESTNNAFEAANFEGVVSAVPLPAALPLMGAAMMGVGAIARRRKA